MQSPIEPSSASEQIEIRSFSTEDDRTRDAFVFGHPDATFFHLSGWRRMIERLYGYEGHDLLAWRGSELVGVLPLMLTPGLFGRKKLISMPFSVYGGALGAGSDVTRGLVEHACRLAERLRVRYLELRNTVDPGVDLPSTELYWTFMRQLPKDPAQVLAGMPKKARAEARKARTQHGLELCQGVWYVDDLYRLGPANKHELGSPSLKREHFYGLIEQFGERVSIHLVRKEKTPLAAVMSFAFRDTLIAYHSGTASGADRAFSVSNFMFMALQEWAVEQGFRVFDFCRSRRDSGAFRFKSHQGFQPRLLPYRYHLVRARSLPSFTPSNPRTALLRNTWSRMPVWLAKRLSPKLSRFIS